MLIARRIKWPLLVVCALAAACGGMGVQRPATAREFKVGENAFLLDGKQQPGGWCFSVLPYVEQQALHDIGIGASGNETQIRAANSRRIPTPVTVFACPTRRPATMLGQPGGGGAPWLIDATPGKAKTCYAANFGDFDVRINRGGDSMVFTNPQPLYHYSDAANFPWWSTADITGICFSRSEVTMAMIPDGTSNTYLLGEKNVCPDYYLTGQDWGDDWPMYVGQQDDIVRSVAYKTSDTPLTYTYYPPVPDQPGVMNKSSFGSAHANGLYMSLCDGSVQFMSYTIDPEVNRRLGNRMDGMTIDGKQF